MRFFILALAAVSACYAASSADLVFPEALKDDSPLDVSNFKYVDNGHSKSRSPCPFLNAAANHNILPNSGKNIRLELFDRLLRKAGLTELFVRVLLQQLGMVAQKAKEKNPSHPDDAIDLSDLIPHNLIEHDVSLSRWDVIDGKNTPGDNFADPALVNRLTKHADSFNEKDGNKAGTITLPSLGSWHNERLRQETEERKHTPDNSFKTQFLCAGECFLLLNILGRDGEISDKDAYTFLVDERFPEGWKAPTDLNIFRTLKRVGDCATAFHMSDDVLSWFGKPWAFAQANEEILRS